MTWRTDGVRVVPADALDHDTPQTPGMHRAAAVTAARVGARELPLLRVNDSLT